MADHGRARRAARWLAVVVAGSAGGLALSSCATGYHFRPVSAGVVHAATDIDIEVIELRRSGLEPAAFASPLNDRAIGTDVLLRWRAPPGTGIAAAFLAPPEASPCHAGIAVAAVFVDGQRRWERPLAMGGGDRRVLLGFAQDHRISDGPLIADIAVVGVGAGADAGAIRCVRVPIATDAVRQRVVEPLWAYTVDATIGETVRSPTQAAGTLALGVGRWLGPLRLTLQVALGGGSARVLSSGDSGSSSSNATDPNDFVITFVGSEVAWFPVVGRRHAAGLSLAYQLGAAFWRAPGQTSLDSNAGMVGPRVSVLLLAIEPRLHGVSGAAPLKGSGVSLFASRPSLWPGQRERGAAYVIGVGYTVTWGGGGWE